MKKTLLGYTMVSILGLFTYTPAMAAIGCLPGECHGHGGGSGGVPTSVQGWGYYEVSSPQCLQTDMIAAQKGALDKAKNDAQVSLGSLYVRQISNPRYIILKCEQSVYAGSSEGNSWIVTVVVDYSL